MRSLARSGRHSRDITAFVRGSLVARYKLPAIYPFRFFVSAGGLMSYGHDPIDPHRRAAAYVDRIELVINLKTAKAHTRSKFAPGTGPKTQFRRGEARSRGRLIRSARRR
jgi:hypothetical protein